MIPLGLTKTGSFFVGRRPHSKGSWVCKTPSCLAKIIDKPNRLKGRRKLTAPSSQSVRAHLKDHCSDLVQKQLIEAMRSGTILLGSHQVKKCKTENIEFLLFSGDSGTRTRSEISFHHNGIETFTIEISSRKIGELLGRGPRSVLALRRSRKTHGLIDTLRAWYSLG